MRINLYCLLATFFLTGSMANAQLGMGGQPHTSAVLDLQSPSNNKAFYPPRLTSTQRNAIVDPQPGAMVYDTDKGTLYLHNGQGWLPMALAASEAGFLTSFSATGTATNKFGVSVAVSGDYAIVGESTDATSLGKAYIFARSGGAWVQQTVLNAPTFYGFGYGYSVAISGDYAVVGAYNANNIAAGWPIGHGIVYIYARSGTVWSLVTSITQPARTEGDYFGTSVAISGDYLVVGAPGVNNNWGIAYVYMRSGTLWGHQAMLLPDESADGDQFGSKVAISGDYILAGAAEKDINGNSNQGAVYVFARNGSTWTQQARLTASDGAGNDLFGKSLAIEDVYAIVGAPGKDVGANTDQGAAYVFIRNGSTWTQQARITATDGTANDLFGAALSLSGNKLLVGAPDKTIGTSTKQGTAYGFTRTATSWLQSYMLSDNALAGTLNGTAVGLSNGTFVVSGPGYQSNKGKIIIGTLN